MKYLVLILIICSNLAYASIASLSSESVVVTNVNTNVKFESNVSPSLSQPVVVTNPPQPVPSSAPLQQPNSLLTNPEKVSMPVKKKHRKQGMAKPVSASLADLTFDFNYSGDIAGLPQQLRTYDTHLQVLHALGTPKPLEVSISLEATKIEDISDAVSSQTNNQVHLLFNPADNSVRLNYIGIMDTGDDAVKESLKWQQGGAPRPVLKQDGIVRFPYGEYQPVIICRPLNLCDVELQAGEEIQGIVIGDSLRWNEGDNGIPIVYSGTAGNLTPHLVLKPSQGGLDTNLMVTTSKRTYMLRIKSALNNSISRAGFYYPAETIQTFTANKDKLDKLNPVNTGHGSIANPDVQKSLLDLSKVNYAYSVSGEDYPWKPTQVFDDGISVYIQLPDNVSSRALPGICILTDGDDSETKCEMVNFRYNDHFYIVDKLFNQAKLINGYGDYMQIVTIKRKPDKASFWSRLFG